MSIFNKPYEEMAANADAGSGDTLIAQGVRVEGDFVSEGNVIIEGEVHGTISTSQHLIVGTHAKIVANVQAATALVAGTVEGNMQVAGKIELKASSRVTGDLAADDLMIESGAVLNGRISMKQLVPESSSVGNKKKKLVREEMIVGDAMVETR